MSFEFSEKHEEFRKKCKEVIEECITNNRDIWDDKASIPRELFHELGKRLKINGVVIPENDGGLGLDYSYAYVFIQELIKNGSLSLFSSITIQVNTICPLISRFGSDFVKHEFLKPLIDGEAVGALAVSEPTGGSDLVGSTNCFAEKCGNEWVINGEKTYITNAPIADTLIVFCKTKKNQTPLSMSFIIVPTNTKGFEIEELKKSNQKGSQIGKLKFNDCRVPVENLVGKENMAYIYLSEVFLEERLSVATASIILAEKCLNDTITYLKNREAIDGKSLFKSSQAIRHELAVMATEVKACKSFIENIIMEFVKNKKLSKVYSCMAKYVVTEKSQKIIRKSVELFGSHGLYEGTWMEKATKDVGVLSIYGGTSETMRELVSASLNKIYG